jgi:hypothetical protein
LSGAGRIYFDLPGVAIVKWDAASQAAHVEWQGWASPTEFRAASDAVVQAITEHHSTKVLGDSRQMKVIQKGDQEWINHVWAPHILAAGLTRMALVLPESGLAKMNIDDMASRVADRLDMAYFATLDDARRWLARPATEKLPASPVA